MDLSWLHCHLLSFHNVEVSDDAKDGYQISITRFLTLWCAILFIMFSIPLSIFLATSSLNNTVTVYIASCSAPVILAVMMFLLTVSQPSFRGRIAKILYMLSLLVLGLSGWIIQTSTIIEMRGDDLPFLSGLLAVVGDNPQAKAQLLDYVRECMIRDVLYSIILANYFLLDSLRMLFFWWPPAHFVPLAVLLTTMWASRLLSVCTAGVPVVCALCALYSCLSGWHMAFVHRGLLHLNSQLQASRAAVLQGQQEIREVEVAEWRVSKQIGKFYSHVLDNIVADALGCLELHFEGSGVARDSAEHLERARRCLTEGLQWCKCRQALLNVHLGSYIPTIVPVNLEEFGRSVLWRWEVRAEFLPAVVHFDPTLCRVVLLNAVNNAFKHGRHPDPAVAFRMRFVEPLTAPADLLRRARLVFEVTNRVDPRARGVPAHPFARPPTPGTALRHCMLASLADALPLQELQTVAQLMDMELSVTQEGDEVCFQAALNVELPANESGPVDGRADAFPPGLQVLCLDDSDVARRLILHAFRAYGNQPRVAAYGKCLSDVEVFIKQALNDTDIVLLDQFLDFGHTVVLGTDLVTRLLSSGFKGFVSIWSANVTEEDSALFRGCGAHCVVGKDVPCRSVVDLIKAEYLRHHHATTPPAAAAVRLLRDGDSEDEAGGCSGLPLSQSSSPLLGSPAHLRFASHTQPSPTHAALAAARRSFRLRPADVSPSESHDPHDGEFTLHSTCLAPTPKHGSWINPLTFNSVAVPLS
eukprot:EG_transcript_3155